MTHHALKTIPFVSVLAALPAYAQQTNSDPDPASRAVASEQISSTDAPTAATPTEAPGRDTHTPSQASENAHDGFYFSVRFGGGFRATALGSEGTLAGGGTAFGLALGTTIANNLVLHGEITSSRTSVGKLYDGSSPEDLGRGMSLATAGFGPGITYYNPKNLYVGGAALLSRTVLMFHDDPIAETNLGIGAALRAGKEFWLRKGWAVGVGAEALFSFAEEAHGKDSVGAGTLSLLVSGTYN